MKRFFSALVMSGLLAVTASAATITVDNGQAGNNQQLATINYTFGLDSLQIVIDGLVTNPNSVFQGVSAIDFTVTGGLTANLSSVSGNLYSISGAGIATPVAGTPDWFQSGTITTGLGASGPDNILIGTANPDYSSAGGSIKGNGPHNPFTIGSITLNYEVLGATSASNFNTFLINFNTTYDWIRIPPDRIPPNEVPEPSTYALIGGSLLALGFARRRR